MAHEHPAGQDEAGDKLEAAIAAVIEEMN